MYKSRFQGEIQARTRSLKVTSIQTILKVMGLHEHTQRMDKERCEVQNWLLGPTSFGGGGGGWWQGGLNTGDSRRDCHRSRKRINRAEFQKPSFKKLFKQKRMINWVKCSWKVEKDENGVLAAGCNWLLLTLTATGLVEWQGWKPECGGNGENKDWRQLIKKFFPTNSATKKWGGRRRGEEGVHSRRNYFLRLEEACVMSTGMIQCSRWIYPEQWGSPLVQWRDLSG